MAIRHVVTVKIVLLIMPLVDRDNDQSTIMMVLAMSIMLPVYCVDVSAAYLLDILS